MKHCQRSSTCFAGWVVPKASKSAFSAVRSCRRRRPQPTAGARCAAPPPKKKASPDKANGARTYCDRHNKRRVTRRHGTISNNAIDVRTHHNTIGTISTHEVRILRSTRPTAVQCQTAPDPWAKQSRLQFSSTSRRAGMLLVRAPPFCGAVQRNARRLWLRSER